MDGTLLLVILGASLAGFAQGVSGFAFALVSLSIWAWGIEPRLAAVLTVFGSLVGQLVTLPFVWRGFDVKRALPLIVGGLIGIPIGASLLTALEPGQFRLGLGLFLVVYCPVMLLLHSGRPFRWGGAAADAGAGWIGGVLGGLAGISGPIPTLWTTLRGWDKNDQRGILQGFNIAMHTATLTVYGLSGAIRADMTVPLVATGVALVPFAILGVLVFRRLSTIAFRRLILMLLSVSGVVLIWGAVATG